MTDDNNDIDRSDEYLEVWGEVNGAALLDEVVDWWRRFIAVTYPDDLYLLALWTAHTHLVKELYTTPRLLIDSIMEGSGKTTVLDHLNRLCCAPIQAASISSPALIPRLLQNRMRTILIDETHRALRPDKPGVEDLLGIINTGYRRGATRPVLVPSKGGGWDAHEMPTFAPVAMAGNNPNLPPDTVSRQIRILLMPDLDGTVEDSDWEVIESDARKLQARLRDWADSVREDIKDMDVSLPKKCIGRSKEKWRPLARVAKAANGKYPAVVTRLIEENMAEEEAEREAGLKTRPPGMVVLCDLYELWPKHPDGAPKENFIGSSQLVESLIFRSTYWGADSPYGKALTEHRLGRLLSQAAKITSTRIGGKPPRGYLWQDFEPVWRRLGIAPRKKSDESDATDESDDDQSDESDESDDGVGLDSFVAFVASNETPNEVTLPGFTPPTGPGRCDECGWHIEKQGHKAGCSAKPDDSPPF
jgi:hypothetical protein